MAGPANAADVLLTAVAAIEARLAELDDIRANYIGYLERRKRECDWHGAWDASVNISETECEQSGLRFALAALGRD